MSEGKTALANTMLDSLAQLNALEAAWVRAYFATLPFLAQDEALRSHAVSALATTSSRPTAAPLYLELSVNASAASIIQRYLEVLLHARGNSASTTTLECSTLLAGAIHELCIDMEHGLAAERSSNAGSPEKALSELERMSLRVPYQLAGRSVFFARSRERFLRAQLLERVGRLPEAYNWYGSASHTARQDYIYLAPSHLGRARIREKEGDMKMAAFHYKRAAELLANADSGAMVLKREADAGAVRTRRP
jgi:tetratricopeptide (TPR) repeat protein